mgnify:FL=1
MPETSSCLAIKKHTSLWFETLLVIQFPEFLAEMKERQFSAKLACCRGPVRINQGTHRSLYILVIGLRLALLTQSAEEPQEK